MKSMTLLLSFCSLFIHNSLFANEELLAKNITVTKVNKRIKQAKDKTSKNFTLETRHTVQDGFDFWKNKFPECKVHFISVDRWKYYVFHENNVKCGIEQKQ